MKRIISFLGVLVFSLILLVTNRCADVIANELNNDLSNDSKPNNIQNKKDNKSDIPKASNEDIFGYEQAFPFIAGFGKKAAH